MRKSQITEILTGKGLLHVEYLDKGKSKTAFLYNDDTVLLRINERNNVAAQNLEVYRWVDADLPYMPQIENREDLNVSYNGHHFSFAQAPYYAPVTTEYKKELKHLRSLWKTAKTEVENYYQCVTRTNYTPKELNYDAVQFMPEKYRNSLYTLADAAINYNLWFDFEFTERNCGVDSEGNLIWFDVLLMYMPSYEQQKYWYNKTKYKEIK